MALVRLLPASGTDEAISATAINARSSVVLPEPFGPMRTATVGSRMSGLTALRRKHGRSGAVPGMRRSRTTSSRIEW